MPLDKKKIDALLVEIKLIEDRELKKKQKILHQTIQKTAHLDTTIKKRYLLPTEKQMYFLISHHYKLTMLSIDEPATAIEIWIKGILPTLLQHHAIEFDEWERICNIGDADQSLEEEQNESWSNFFKNKIRKGRIDRELLILINEGKNRVKKLRGEL